MRIVIATARPPRSVQSFLPQELLEISSFVYYNGACISDLEAEFEEYISLTKDDSREILNYCSTNLPHCKISVESKDHWYTSTEVTDAITFNDRFQPSIMTIDQLKDLEATKILLMDFEDAENLLVRFGDKVNVILTDQGKLIQIVNIAVSKATGILRLCALYAVDPSDVMVFGDDYNDIEMFNMAGYSVAMSNAVDELKQMAMRLRVRMMRMA